MSFSSVGTLSVLAASAAGGGIPCPELEATRDGSPDDDRNRREDGSDRAPAQDAPPLDARVRGRAVRGGRLHGPDPRSVATTDELRRAVAATAAEVAEAAAAAEAGLDIAALRTTAQVAFDPLRFFPLAQSVMTMLGVQDIAALACLEPGGGRKPRRRRGAYRGPGSGWVQCWASGGGSAARRDFDATYADFLRAVVLPYIADPRGICFQVAPTFRAHVSGGGEATGRPHTDAEYGHQRGTRSVQREWGEWNEWGEWGE